jgi:hypothetical protein
MANGKMDGLGDIHTKVTDPLETYFDTIQQGVALPRRRWIVKPDFEPCAVKVPPGPGAEIAQKIVDAQQQMLECHTLPRLWQTLMDLWIKLQCGTYFVKNPNWLEPPVTASPIEILANSGLGTTVDAAAGTDEIIATYVVPDRIVGSLLAFANNIDTPAQVGNIQWNITVNSEPKFGYAGFFGSLGAIDDPRPLASHIPLKHGDVVEVRARKVAAGPDVVAFTRLQGFSFVPPKISQTGDFAQYHTI